ncbi:N-formylglutamate deformylase [Betaproteobacteria bacterium GR16-43]|nr:N-formylglutamate deformylase [Betaproteobacteria bacterium GR16-43]
MIVSEHGTPPYLFRRGTSALVVSMPHAGTYVAPSIGRTLADVAAQRPDTDWHLAQLHDFIQSLDATVLVAMHSRYAIDLNRPPDDANLYPGQDTTGLVPVDTFDRRKLYRAGNPGPAEVQRRVERYWQPYHRRLAREIERVKSEHGRVVLWDAHSIRSVVPRFFEGRLADLNLGNADGRACDPGLAEAVLGAARRHREFTSVLNGRFKGGYITRHYGKPSAGVHALQLEMSEATYMDEEPPFAFRDDLAARVRPVLHEMMETALSWAK